MPEINVPYMIGGGIADEDVNFSFDVVTGRVRVRFGEGISQVKELKFPRHWFTKKFLAQLKVTR
jgi:hypothetical protein